MKQLKKLLLMFTCVGVLMSVTACGSDNQDNGAVENPSETENEATQNTGNAYDDNTDVDDESMKNDKGMMEKAGDKVQEGVDKAEDDLNDAVNRNESTTTKNQ